MAPRTKKNIVLYLFLCLSIVSGFFDGYFRVTHRVQHIPAFAPILGDSVLIFFWYYYDALEHGYRRSRWLNISVIAFSAIFVPVYLFKSRAKGSRASALGGFALVVLLYVLLRLVGMVCGGLLHG